jgi:hypothetical protein
MDYIDLNGLDEPHTRWVSFGGVEFLLKYASPRESDKFRRSLMAKGIMRQKDGGLEINAGRESDFYRAFAEQYVLDWRGQIRPAGTAYTPELMARVLAGHGGILRAIQEAISEDEAFFGNNGSAPTRS